MAKIVAGIGSSHAQSLKDPSEWDAQRERNRHTYAQRYGALPDPQPQIAEETDEDIHTRFATIRTSLDFVRDKLAELKPDALILIGDDQNENFREDNLPQIAIYLGEDFLARGQDRGGDTFPYRCETGLAQTIFEESIEADIDMASVKSLPDNILQAHAFGPMLRRLDPEARIPVVPIYINEIHVPAPPPARCYYYGQALKNAIDQYAGAERVAILASGGLSHFTGGYPYKHYHGPFTYGCISEDFDRSLVRTMQAGDGSALAKLSNKEILDNGDIEFRAWITLLGAIGDLKPDLMVYEPFYRGLMGLAVGYWTV